MIEILAENGINLKKIGLYVLGGIIVLIIAISLIISYFFTSKYVIIDESLILTRKFNRWSQVYEFKDDIEDYSYTVSGKFGTIKNVKVDYDSSGYFYYYDKNYKSLDLNHVSAVYTDKFKGIKVADSEFSYYDSNDDVILEKAFGDKDIDSYKDSIMKNSYDLDGDGKKEVIYTLSNQTLDGSHSSKFSSIFAVSGDSFIGFLDNDNKSPYIVYDIIDLDGDGKYEVIVSKGSEDVATFDTCFQIYSYKKGKFNRIMDCK